MRQAHSRLSLVDVLATCAAGAICVDANLIPVERYLGIVLYLWNDFKHCERCLSALLSVKWRDAHQAMNTALCAQPSECIATTNL